MGTEGQKGSRLQGRKDRREEQSARPWFQQAIAGAHPGQRVRMARLPSGAAPLVEGGFGGAQLHRPCLHLNMGSWHGREHSSRLDPKDHLAFSLLSEEGRPSQGLGMAQENKQLVSRLLTEVPQLPAPSQGSLPALLSSTWTEQRPAPRNRATMPLYARVCHLDTKWGQ